jgi:phenylacetate-CoA ligase
LAFRPELSWEFLSADEIEAKSIRAMRNHIRHVKEVSAFYRESLSGVDPEDIKAMADIGKLPLTGRVAFADRAAAFQAVSDDHVVETAMTSGATGKPLSFPLTAMDLERLGFNEALSFYSAGVTAADRADLCVGFDRCSLSGVAYYRGLTQLGVNTARRGMLPADSHKLHFSQFKPTVLVGAPSFFRRLSVELARLGFDKNASPVRKIFCVQESIRTREMQLSAAGKAIEDFYGAAVYSSYGNTELSSSFCECEARCGGHAHPELIFAEIVDEKGASVADGAAGELVATPLGVEGNPLVRYKTGDITFKISGQCACGRNSMRIGPVIGRVAHAIRMKDTVMYPPAVTNVLDGIEGIEDYLIILENDDGKNDHISIHLITPPSNMAKISSMVWAELRVNLPLLISNIPTIKHLRGRGGREIKIIDHRKHGAAAGVRGRG